VCGRKVYDALYNDMFFTDCSRTGLHCCLNMDQTKEPVKTPMVYTCGGNV